MGERGPTFTAEKIALISSQTGSSTWWTLWVWRPGRQQTLGHPAAPHGVADLEEGSRRLVGGGAGVLYIDYIYILFMYI